MRNKLITLIKLVKLAILVLFCAGIVLFVSGAEQWANLAYDLFHAN